MELGSFRSILWSNDIGMFPEPATALLLGAGAMAFLGRNWGKTKTEEEAKVKRNRAA